MAFALGYAAVGFLLAGFSEVLSPLFCLIILGLWYRTRNRKYLAAIVGMALGTFIILIAPGNAIRAASLPARVDLLRGISNTLNVTGLFLIGQVTDHGGALLLAFLVGYLCPFKLRIRRKLLWFEALVLIIIFASAFTLFVPLYFASGLDARHFTFASFITIVSVGTMGVLCAGTPQSQS